VPDAEPGRSPYDVVWLLDAIGPAEAARRIAGTPLLAGDLARDVLGQLRRLINDQFRDLSAVGPGMYASFLGANDSDANRRHAHGTLAALGKALGARDIQLAEADLLAGRRDFRGGGVVPGRGGGGRGRRAGEWSAT
jgi:hypothetical protein